MASLSEPRGVELRDDRSGARRMAAVLLLFTVSGATGLILEVAWSRMLITLLGGTTWGLMAVLVAYMGGLGIGSYLWGRGVARASSPLQVFGRLELAIGAYSLLVPWLFRAIGALFLALARMAGGSNQGGPWLPLLAAVLALAPPTILMGGTLPMLARVASRWVNPGRATGLLYATNTAGAVLGCFTAGFFLIPALGVIETNWLAAGLDAAVGALAWRLGRRSSVAPTEETAEPSKPRASAPSGWVALAVATASGYCGLSYEVVWTRAILATLTESTTFAFTLMLSVFLAGHAFGSWLAVSRGRRRGPQCEPRDWPRLGLAQAVAGLLALLSLPLLVAGQGLMDLVLVGPRSTFWGLMVPFHLGVCLFVVAPTATLLGASLPLAARLYVGRGRPVGEDAGRLFALNTIGGVFGATLTTVALIPRLGTQHAMASLALAQAALGIVVLVGGGGRPGLARRINAAVVLAILLASALVLDREYPLTTIYARKEPGALLATAEGPDANVTVHRRQAGDMVININGVNVAGTNRVLRTTQKLQAHLPLLLHPAPRSVLQIGFGAGGTCHSVARHREVTTIDVVELTPAVITLARDWFRDVNRGVLDDPRVRVRIADARSEMAASERSYDLIMSDSIHPRYRGNAMLYTRDYFALASRRLRPGGLFSTWLPLYGISTDDLRGILRSLHAVFPHVQVWYPNANPNENTIVIASMEPVTVKWPEFADRLAEPAISADLAEVGIGTPAQLLDYFVLGERTLGPMVRGAYLNTDDHPTLEFSAPRTLYRSLAWAANLRCLRAAREPIDPYLVGAGPSVRGILSRWFEATTDKLEAQSDEIEGRPDEALDAYDRCVRRNPDDLDARRRRDGYEQLLTPRPRR